MTPTTFLLAEMYSRGAVERVGRSAQPGAPVRAPRPRRGIRRLWRSG
jgi:hypothetical protein